MPRKQVRNKKENTGNTGWALALERAEFALYKNRARKAQIMQAIRFFQEQIKKGVSWPMESKVAKKGNNCS
jgi:hypothetical protein